LLFHAHCYLVILTYLLTDACDHKRQACPLLVWAQYLMLTNLSIPYTLNKQERYNNSTKLLYTKVG